MKTEINEITNVLPLVSSESNLVEKQLPSTASLYLSINLKISKIENNLSLELLNISKDSIINLWNLNKYLELMISYYQGFIKKEEFDNLANNFVKEPEEMTFERLRLTAKYLKFLIPEIEMEDLSTIFSISVEKMEKLLES